MASRDVLLLAENTGVGGINTYLVLIADEMRRRGVKVDLAAIWPKPDNWLQQRCDEIGLPLWVLASRRSLIEFPRVIWSLTGLVRRHRYRVIHGQGYYSDLLAHAARIASGGHASVVATVHGLPESRNLGLRLLYWLDKHSLRWTSKTITQTRDTARRLEGIWVEPERLVIVPNGIVSRTDAERIAREVGGDRKETDVPVVAFVGRLSSEKGCDVLIESARLLRERGRAFRLRIVGDGPDRGRLAQQVRRAFLGDAVVFEGWQSDVSRYYRAADVVVVPSLRENQPLTALEAMLYGCPVVATDVGGVSEVIHHEQTGLLAAPGDPASLARALDRCLMDAGLRATLGQAGQAYVIAQHTIEQMVDRTIAVYPEPVQRSMTGNGSMR